MDYQEESQKALIAQKLKQIENWIIADKSIVLKLGFVVFSISIDMKSFCFNFSPIFTPAWACFLSTLLWQRNNCPWHNHLIRFTHVPSWFVNNVWISQVTYTDDDDESAMKWPPQKSVWYWVNHRGKQTFVGFKWRQCEHQLVRWKVDFMNVPSLMFNEA